MDDEKGILERLGDVLWQLQEIPWTFLVFIVVVVVGLNQVMLNPPGLGWGDYLGAVTVAAGLHGVSHGIRNHTRKMTEGTTARPA